MNKWKQYLKLICHYCVKCKIKYIVSLISDSLFRVFNWFRGENVDLDFQVEQINSLHWQLGRSWNSAFRKLSFGELLCNKIILNCVWNWFSFKKAQLIIVLVHVYVLFQLAISQTKHSFMHLYNLSVNKRGVHKA